jgi:hypothetical protein
MRGGLNIGGNIHPSTKTIDAAKASADGADTLAAAKHLHARGPKRHRRQSNRPSNKTINTTKAFADGANTLPAAKHLQKRGLSDDYGYNKHQLGIPK